MSSPSVDYKDSVRAELTEEIRAEVTKELTIKFEAEFIKKCDEYQKLISVENEKTLQKVVEEWKASQKPPTEDEVALLLGQEYFEVKVTLNDPDKEGQQKEFVIRELPQSVEKKFYKKIKSQLLPKLSELANVSVRIADEDTEGKFKAIIEAFEPTFDVLAETTALILNPFGKNGVTPEWAQDNISSFRQWNIILAQERANKIRDFFSHASRGSLSGIVGGASYRR
jgi:hypothetical protein